MPDSIHVTMSRAAYEAALAALRRADRAPADGRGGGASLEQLDLRDAIIVMEAAGRAPLARA